LRQSRSEQGQVSVDELIESAEQVDGVKVIAREVPGCDAGTMRSLIDQLRRKAAPVAVLLASRADDGVQLVAGLSRDLVERGLNASDWVKYAAKEVGGGGGGRPDLAQAGGKKPEGLKSALAAGLEFIKASNQRSAISNQRTANKAES
jgi:alanyl-tRNA synthetase